jgi:HAD superfamily hydrolase (TIGR01509 family)
MSVTAALFDWDGTLIDSRAALLSAWRESTEAVLGRSYPATAEEEDIVFTLPGREIWPTLTDDVDSLAASFQVAYDRSGEQVRAFPGVLEMLEELRSAGVRTAVVTSKSRRRYAPDAVRAELAGSIDIAICAEDVTATKPDPDPVLRALEKLGVAGTDALMAGDTPVDVAAALAAGTTAIGVGWGHFASADLLAAGASAVAEEPGELVAMALEAAA